MTDLEAFVLDEKRVAKFLDRHESHSPDIHNRCMSCDHQDLWPCDTAKLLALLADRDAKLAAVRELAEREAAPNDNRQKSIGARILAREILTALGGGVP